MPTPNDSVTVYSNPLNIASPIIVGWKNALTAGWNGPDSTNQPQDKFVYPVAPVCVRTANVNPTPETMERRQDLGAITLILLSDIWGYDPDTPPW